jgi:hypothetical protein
MSKDEGDRNSSFREKPVRPRPRRLVGWINLMGAKEVPLNSFFGISDVLILRETCMREKPSSQTPLLESGPLRTVRASFLAHSSSPVNAS